ncbi:putative NADH-dependent dehydrogenase [Thermogutta terrifontis]|uniref:Putative NADH-dependent dehydrogenase n=1 Tax=Thermogutta terrifontis TaxID=1331910 RepID=A0A286RLN1_9BACT|nr:Gfo/Idh/MocA family oxidoreductase [Thermogutta terrifontis]ASV76869.1 putative NADH-dependent dehydrogenase [Thermogutta terrifontis]
MLSSKVNRRGFVASSALATVATVVPRSVLGGPGFVPPSEKIHIGYVGCGTQGLRQLMQALPRQEIRIVAVCDPNRKSDDYPEWGPREIVSKVRAFLEDPRWGEGARGGLCGREVGLEIVSRYYAKASDNATERPQCRAYSDFRQMLADERDLDAVYIMTPDHLHGVIAARALKAGKHAITHKPISNVLQEVRILRDLAQQTGLATQLFCAADNPDAATIAEWIQAGAIGQVREVHNWSTRPFWPQGMTEYPTEKVPLPDGFEWDLWLGPAQERPYHPAYTHAVFRGWYDFGTGALGDMGHYSFYQIFKILGLGSPVSVEASRSQFWRIENYTWKKQINRVSYPRASLIHWEFPSSDQRSAVKLHWYDGGLRPELLAELEVDGLDMPEEGMLFVGDQGKILAGFTGNNPRLIPQKRMKDFQPPPKRLPRPAGELDQFIRACRGEAKADANFVSVYPMAETILLGTIAVRVNQKLRWDTTRGEFTNSAEANALIRRENRPGWEL